jgi:hypothetical protein
MKNQLKIASVELNDDLKQLTLRLRIQNPGDRTLHACASVRALRYDPATRTLEVQLSDRGLRDTGPRSTFLQPKFTSVDPNSETTLELSLPRTIARLKPGHNQIAPTVEELPAHEAQHINVEIAYSGTPFYRDPRPKTGKSPRQMMVDWAEGVAKHKESLRDAKV